MPPAGHWCTLGHSWIAMQLLQISVYLCTLPVTFLYCYLNVMKYIYIYSVNMDQLQPELSIKQMRKFKISRWPHMSEDVESVPEK